MFLVKKQGIRYQRQEVFLFTKTSRQSSPPSAEVKNEWSYTSNPLYAFMVCLEFNSKNVYKEKYMYILLKLTNRTLLNKVRVT